VGVTQGGKLSHKEEQGGGTSILAFTAAGDVNFLRFQFLEFLHLSGLDIWMGDGVTHFCSETV